MAAIIFVGALQHLMCVYLRIRGKSIQILLVAALAHASRVMRSVFVRTCTGLALVSDGHVAGVAEKFGLVRSLIVTAHIHLLYALQDVCDVA